MLRILLFDQPKTGDNTRIFFRFLLSCDVDPNKYHIVLHL